MNNSVQAQIVKEQIEYLSYLNDTFIFYSSKLVSSKAYNAIKCPNESIRNESVLPSNFSRKCTTILLLRHITSWAIIAENYIFFLSI